MGGSALAGVAVGNWLVRQAPVVDAATRTNTSSKENSVVLDPSGRPLAPEAPQPLTNGQLGIPEKFIQPMWEVQAVSLFDSNLDPMVSLAIGDRVITIEDILNQAGSGLPTDTGDVATIDITQGSPSMADDPIARLAQQQQPQGSANTSWETALEQAIKACDSVGFFSRPGCQQSAREKYCTPNKAWGKHRLCPANNYDPTASGA